MGADGNRVLGTRLAQDERYDLVLRQGRPWRGSGAVLDQRFLLAYDPILDANGRVIGAIAVGTDETEVLSSIEGILFNVIITGVTVSALIILILYFATRQGAGLLVRLSKVMERLSASDTAVAVPFTDRGDEIGVMARTVEIFRASMIRNSELITAGNRDHEARVQRSEHVMQLTSRFDTDAGSMLEIFASSGQTLQATATGVATVAERASRRAEAVASASQHAATHVQSVEEAARQLAQSIDEIGQRVSESAELANTAVAEADDSNAKVQQLAEAAQRIDTVVQLITSIAEQTNLLALNATIEAARAGDAGKGFAVVASEVKNLAGQTARATHEISEQIMAIQNATGSTVLAIRQIGERIRQMSEIATAVAGAVEEQHAATREIARSVEQAASGTREVNDAIGEVAQAARDNGSAATEVLGEARRLSGHAEQLKQCVKQFLGDVRAA